MSLSLKVILFVAWLSLFQNDVNGLNCNEMPKGNPKQCCKSSGQYKDLEKVTKIAREHEEDKFSDYMMECKINQDVFKEFKLTNGNDDVDMDAVINYLDSAFTDKISAESYKVSAQECYEEISSNFVKIQSKYEAAPFELNRTDCNVKFMAMATCMEIKKFLNCPKENAVESSECDDVHQWVKECTKDIYSFKEIISRSDLK